MDPTITKTVDKPTASIGEVLTYTVTINNVSETSISNVVFSDTIPEGSTYIVASFNVDEVSVTPTVTGSTLSYNIPSIDASGSKVISFQTLVVGGEQS